MGAFPGMISCSHQNGDEDATAQTVKALSSLGHTDETWREQNVNPDLFPLIHYNRLEVTHSTVFAQESLF